MPYKTKKVKGKGTCVYKKDGGKKVGCTTGPVQKYLAALHVHESFGDSSNPNKRIINYKGYVIEDEIMREEDNVWHWITVKFPDTRVVHNPRHRDTKEYFTIEEIKDYIDRKLIEKGKQETIASGMTYYDESVNLFQRLLEDIEAEAVAPKKIKIENPDTGKVELVDISNFIYANTNGGTEPVTLYGIRANDSKTDPSKKAGSEMVINGRMTYKYKPTGGPSPMGNAQQRYGNYDILTLEVSSVDGKAYPPKTQRNIKVSSVTKIVMGGEVYKILR